MNWYLSALRKYFVFQGRARRKEYWFFWLFNTIFLAILSVLDNSTGTFNPDSGYGLLSGIYSLVVFIPSLAVSVRRLHDTSRSGWWLLISLIPLIGFIVLLIFMLQNSTLGQNQYGANPKGFN